MPEFKAPVYLYVVETGNVYEGGRAIAATLHGSVATKIAFEYMKKQDEITDEMNESLRKQGDTASPFKHYGLDQNNRWENGNDYVLIRTFEDGVMED